MSRGRGCRIRVDDEKGRVMMKEKEGKRYRGDGEGNMRICGCKRMRLCVGEKKIMIDREGNI